MRLSFEQTCKMICSVSFNKLASNLLVLAAMRTKTGSYFFCLVTLLYPQVFDDIGKDVTPRPLYQPEPSVAGPTPGPMHRPSKILSTQDFAGAVPTEFLSSLSLQQASGTSISLAGPFSRYDTASQPVWAPTAIHNIQKWVEKGFGVLLLPFFGCKFSCIGWVKGQRSL